jgi:acylphosphatase
VQGVFYRQSAREKASALGITGTAMNLRDGRVQIMATATKEQLEQLITWCRQGPLRAEVENVIAEEIPLQVFSDFTIIRR